MPETKAATGTTLFYMNHTLETKLQNSEGANLGPTFSEASVFNDVSGQI